MILPSPLFPAMARLIMDAINEMRAILQDTEEGNYQYSDASLFYFVTGHAKRLEAQFALDSSVTALIESYRSKLTAD